MYVIVKFRHTILLSIFYLSHLGFISQFLPLSGLIFSIPSQPGMYGKLVSILLGSPHYTSGWSAVHTNLDYIFGLTKLWLFPVHFGVCYLYHSKSQDFSPPFHPKSSLPLLTAKLLGFQFVAHVW